MLICTTPSERLATRTVHLRFMHVNALVTTTSYRVQLMRESVRHVIVMLVKRGVPKEFA